MWHAIKKFFKDSEVIFLARAQMVLGALAAVVIGLLADPTVNAAIQTILTPQYVPYYVIGLGVLTELLRRRRATDL